MMRIADKSWVLGAGLRLWRFMTAERQIIVRSHGEVRHVRLSRAAHLATCLVVAAGISWVGYSTSANFGLRDTVRHLEIQITSGDEAFSQLNREVSDSRQRFLAIAGVLERNHTQLVGIIGQNHSLRGDVESLRGKLERTEDARRETNNHREVLKRRLSRLEGAVVHAESRNTELADTLESATTRLSDALVEKSQEPTRGERMKSRVVELQSRLSDVRQSQESLLGRITDATISDIGRAEAVIARTGLSADRLIQRAPPSENASGGPFIPIDGTATGAFEQGLASLYAQMDRWETLRRLVRHLPLMSPVDQYYVASRFGRRRDPFNKKWAVHKGLDLAGPAGQKIRSPAAGTVVFAGRNGRFGRFIEIDHGFGIRTRYGHLRRILVKKGRRVMHRQDIGVLGNTGRSTGPHLHYEIVVDENRVDPSKFLNARRDVFKG
jgi:murein DD-endopeptidase MepM/ murein hydrolase activator NlpD